MLETFGTQSIMMQENATVQDEAQVTSAPKISKDMGEVHWEKLTMEEIYARHRAIGAKACNPTPGASKSFANQSPPMQVPLRTTYNNKRVQLVTLLDPMTDSHRHVIPSTLPDAPPGTIHIRKNDPHLHVKCADGWIGCTKLKFETRDAFEMKDFYNGYQPKSGKSRFCVAEDFSQDSSDKPKSERKGRKS